MNRNSWILLSLFGLLGILYAAFFTDWFAPAPIRISYQVRPTIAQPRFRRIVKPLGTNQFVATPPPSSGIPADPAPGDVAHVTFSLDDFYRVDSIRVLEIRPNGSDPHVTWTLKGKSSLPMNAIIYGRNPDGLASQLGPAAEGLKPNVPYRLEIHAGRHHGQVDFSTMATSTAPEPDGN
jgi:hypothetical protein